MESLLHSTSEKLTSLGPWTLIMRVKTLSKRLEAAQNDVQDLQVLQTHINNGTITPEDKKTSIKVPHAIQTKNNRSILVVQRCISFRFFLKKADKRIHSHSNQITPLINNTKFNHTEAKEALTIMLLQHTICYHKSRDWIHQQDQQQLTYQTNLSHC